jgi:PKD repeat protein
VAPCFVYFDATATDSDGDNSGGEWMDDLVDASFSWNFGDSIAAAKTWANGARATGAAPLSKNVDRGFVAAHLFEKAGTYTVTLTVANAAGLAGSTSRTIIVSNWVDATNGPTYCFASSGSFPADSSTCGTGGSATRLTQSNMTAAVNQCTSNGARPARCIFRAGESYTTSGSMSIADAGATNGTIIAGGEFYGFGTGKATITTPSAKGPSQKKGLWLFGTKWNDSSVNGGDQSKTDVVYWNNEVSCSNCSSAFGSFGDHGAMIENYIHDMNGNCWGDWQQTYGAWMGNKLANCGISNATWHMFRNAFPIGMVISHNLSIASVHVNDIYKLNSTDYPQGTVMEHLWFFDNECRFGNGGNSCVALGLQYTGINEPVARSILDSNLVSSTQNPPWSGYSSFELKNCDSCVVRNNTIFQPDTGSGAVEVESQSGTAPSVNNLIVGNSAWNPNGAGCTISPFVVSSAGKGSTSSTTFRNNLYYQASGSCSIVSCNGSPGCVNDHNLRATTQPFSGLMPTTQPDFRLAPGSSPIGQGSSTSSLLIDAVGTARDATPDIGAYEHSTSVSQNPPPPPVLFSQ